MNRSVQILLRREPFTYEQLLEAHKLIDAGADYVLLHFWYNVTTGDYENFPPTVLEVDKKHMLQVYPGFADHINSWTHNHKQL